MACKYFSAVLLLLFFVCTALGQGLIFIRGNSFGISSRSAFNDYGPQISPATNTPLVRHRSQPPAQYPATDLQQRIGESNPYQPQIKQQPREPNTQQQWNGQAPAAASAPAQRPSASAERPAQRPARRPDSAEDNPVTIVNGGNNNLAPQPAGPSRPAPQFSYMENFSTALFQPIVQAAPKQNIIYSPSSVHMLLGMIYGASGGQTADELQQAGRFSANKVEVGQDFERLINSQKGSPNAQLIMASRVYYNNKLGGLNPEYPKFANNYYKTDIEAVSFTRAANTAGRINAWVADSTGNLIRKLVSERDIDPQTEALLVNVVYFKARWANEFSAMDTMPRPFKQSSAAPATNVAMMYNDDVFDYAELPDLNAKVLELPYAGTQITMLFILPNEIDGLAQLERQLANRDLNTIAAQLRRDMVTVRIPKFRIEFEQDMKAPLQRLNVQRMFTRESEVNAMLMRPVKVSKILQKAHIDVNEAGSEAAAATYAKFVPLSLPVKGREFTADHPFVFAIRTPEAVLFIGHVVQPPQVAA